MAEKQESQNQIAWGMPVTLTKPVFDAMKLEGAIVTLERAYYTVNRDRGKVSLHRIAVV